VNTSLFGFFKPRDCKRNRTQIGPISFTVNEGEILGLLGENGSGKSTLIKIMSGILKPSNGEIKILGCNPRENRYHYTQNIGVVLGHKSMLLWDLPMIESFRLFKDMYGIPDKLYHERLSELIKLFNLDAIIHQPVRKLSLGERMKAELTAAVLHNPKILFLDEPTIGLDIVSRLNFKNFIRELNKKNKTTIVLTTHNMQDVEDICHKAFIIDKGKRVFEGTISELLRNVKSKLIEVEYETIKNSALFTELMTQYEVMTNEPAKIKFNVDEEKADELTSQIYQALNISNINILRPTLEYIIATSFYSKRSF
jgi:ABC-2 type transport system ATP-binding protein